MSPTSSNDPSQISHLPAGEQLPKQMSGFSILIIDDNRDLLKLYSQRLHKTYGANIFEATSTYKARQILGSMRVDLILCDLIMPEEGGLEFMRKWRRKEAKLGVSQIPAIAISALETEHYARKALEAGFNRTLAKPIKADILAAAIIATIHEAREKSEASPQPEPPCQRN